MIKVQQQCSVETLVYRLTESCQVQLYFLSMQTDLLPRAVIIIPILRTL